MVKDGPEQSRPQTRGDCVNGPRPCPWVGCRHHLLLDLTRSKGLRAPALRLAVPSPPPALRYSADARLVEAFTDEAVERLSRMHETCSLDVADASAMRNSVEVASILGVSRQDIQFATHRATESMAKYAKQLK